MDEDAPTAPKEVDHELHNRQLFVFGAEAQKKILASNILIAGLAGGVGVELAKDVILSGVRSVTLLDDSPLTLADLSSNCFARAANVGAPRASAIAPALAELNPSCSVTVAPPGASLKDREFLQNFHAVCVCNLPTTLMADECAAVRAAGAHFIATEARGLTALLFADCGSSAAAAPDEPNFFAADASGEAPLRAAINQILPGLSAPSAGSASAASPATSPADSGPSPTGGCDLVVVLSERHGLGAGGRVRLSGVLGPLGAAVNGLTLDIIADSPFALTLRLPAPTSAPYIGGGYLDEVRRPVPLRFVSLARALADPIPFCGLVTDPWVLGWFAAVHASGSAAAAAADPAGVAARAAEWVAAHMPGTPPPPADVAASLAAAAAGHCPSVDTFLGGLAAQTALSAVSQRFAPACQWMPFLFPKALRAEVGSRAPKGCRYDGLAAVYGWPAVEAAQAQQVFVVGAGAIGCELLKILALWGCGHGGAGGVTVTDMDAIERSNLSRQFLFRSHHVGCLKSSTAAAVAQTFNPDLRVVAHTVRVGPESEGTVFGDAFWRAQTLVLTALDNMDARRYIDARCQRFLLPFVDSGTAGVKGHTQPVVPHITDVYSSQHDAPDPSIPVCTLKLFPYLPEHTIQWARDYFDEQFALPARAVADFLAQPSRAAWAEWSQRLSSERAEVLRALKAAVAPTRPRTLEEAATAARRRFEQWFHNAPVDLLHSFPPDRRDKSGNPFWSGEKRQPTPLTFDAADPLHQAFVRSYAAVLADSYGIPHPPVPAIDAVGISAVAAAVPVTTYSAQGVGAAAERQALTDPKAPAAAAAPPPPIGGELDAAFAAEVASLPEPAECVAAGLGGVQAVVFEKDVGTNGHVEFIFACANLRSRVYGIPEVSRDDAQRIAGRIIPAMMTTTAVVCGLVGVEAAKVIDAQRGGPGGGRRPLEDFACANVNVAEPIAFFFDPPGAPTRKYGDREYTVWDRVEIDDGRDITVGELVAKLEQRTPGLEISMVSAGKLILFSRYAPPPRRAERQRQTVATAYEAVGKQPPPAASSYLTLELCCTLNGQDVEVPPVVYRFRF